MEEGVEITNISKSFGSVPAVKSTSLSVKAGSFVSLLGPSGCGKTTTLRMIAGLEKSNSGEVRISGEVVYSVEKGIDIPPNQRRIGFVFQSYALWPHMTVTENLAYPLVRAGFTRPIVDEKVTAMLEMMKAPQLSKRYPGELSGGQQQRVALGRAIVNPNNRVILFDEPLSNLDAKLREELRIELRALQEDLGFTAIYVTHDQAEAMSMSDQVVIMADGRIDRNGDPESVFHDPQSRYVVKFFGAHNILKGKVRALDGDQVTLDTPLGKILSCRGKLEPRAGDSVDVALPIDAIALAEERPQEDCFEAEILGSSYYGNYSDLRLRIPGIEDLRCRITSVKRFARGRKLFGRVTSSAVMLER